MGQMCFIAWGAVTGTGAGEWRKFFNSDVYENWINPHVTGNGTGVLADPSPMPFCSIPSIPQGCKSDLRLLRMDEPPRSPVSRERRHRARGKLEHEGNSGDISSAGPWQGIIWAGGIQD